MEEDIKSTDNTMRNSFMKGNQNKYAELNEEELEKKEREINSKSVSFVQDQNSSGSSFSDQSFESLESLDEDSFDADDQTGGVTTFYFLC